MLTIRPSTIVSGVPGALGAFAPTVVARGAVIATEHPSFVSAPRPAVDPQRHNERFAWSIVDNILLAHPSPASLTALVDTLGQDHYACGLAAQTWEEEGDTRALDILAATYNQDRALVRVLYDVMATNNLVAELKTQRFRVVGQGDFLEAIPETHGFFRLFSRINHACEPNAVLEHPVDRPGPLTLRALRALAAGEEVTINYLGTSYDATGASRLRLVSEYGFRCTCPRCRTLCGWLSCVRLGDKKCPCRRAAYCSSEHQKLDWARHKSGEHDNLTKQ